MKLGEIEVGQTYSVSGSAPTDQKYTHPWDKAGRERLLAVDPEAAHKIYPLQTATPTNLINPNISRPLEWVDVEVMAVGVPYKKGCRGVLVHFKYEGPRTIQFTVHFSTLRTVGDLAEIWLEARTRRNDLAEKYPDPHAVKHWRRTGWVD